MAPAGLSLGQGDTGTPTLVPGVLGDGQCSGSVPVSRTSELIRGSKSCQTVWLVAAPEPSTGAGGWAVVPGVLSAG